MLHSSNKELRPSLLNDFVTLQGNRSPMNGEQTQKKKVDDDDEVHSFDGAI